MSLDRAALGALAVAAAAGGVAAGVASPPEPAPPEEDLAALLADAPARPVIRAFAPETLRLPSGRPLPFEPPWTRGGGGVVAIDSRTVLTPDGHWTQIGERGPWLLFARGGQGPTPALRLDALLASAEVSIVRPDGSVRVCDEWRFGRWVCGPEPWLYVGPSDLEVRGRTERCLWAHPTAEGTLRISFPDLSAGSLSGRYALGDAGASSPEPGDVHLRVLVEDTEELTRSHEQREGFSQYRVAVEPPEGSDTATVAFEVWADTVAQRHFCLDGTIRPRSRREEEGSGAE